MQTTKARRYFVAVNQYRTNSGEGFANTWKVMECSDAAQQRRVIKDGLPLPDQCLIGRDGMCSPSYSTIGIRAATPAEIRSAKRDEANYGPIEKLQEEAR